MTYQNSSEADLENLSSTFRTEGGIAEKKASSFARNAVLLLVCLVGAGVVFAASSTYNTPTASVTSHSFNAKRSVTKATTLALLSDVEKTALFEEFKSTFGRQYETPEEELTRFENFKAFIERVDERNALEASNGGSGTHGVTRFADWTEDEFSGLLGFQESAETKAKYESKRQVYEPDSSKASSTQYVNWMNVYTTPVKDQGYCGSCWAFSAVSQIESDSIRLGLLTSSDVLSPQQVVSCDTNDGGCDGGIPYLAYEYVYNAGGIQTNASYPYTSYWDVTGSCETDSSDYLVTLTADAMVSGETSMESYVLSTGPLSVCVDASNWASYTDGVLSVCGTSVDHCVQAVGVNLEDEEPYWIVRNSWGTSWGVDGLIYLKAGENLCDITYLPTYVTPVSL